MTPFPRPLSNYTRGCIMVDRNMNFTTLCLHDVGELFCSILASESEWVIWLVVTIATTILARTLGQYGIFHGTWDSTPQCWEWQKEVTESKIPVIKSPIEDMIKEGRRDKEVEG